MWPHEPIIKEFHENLPLKAKGCTSKFNIKKHPRLIGATSYLQVFRVALK
jgi:hypothetical protein